MWYLHNLSLAYRHPKQRLTLQQRIVERKEPHFSISTAQKPLERAIINLDHFTSF